MRKKVQATMRRRMLKKAMPLQSKLWKLLKLAPSFLLPEYSPHVFVTPVVSKQCLLNSTPVCRGA
jgi:hypothetical protein